MTTKLGTATYSPEDNKLRMYPFARLDRADYDRLKEAGFKWAPRQEIFVAPMWTPGRESVLLAMCGDIGDEDTSLVERASERAERFEEYSEKRAEDAKQAQEHAASLADGIPFGQPILVGHHSQRKAEKTAQTIENNIKYAVSMWETSEYWQRRAAGALANAKYKERPDVRHRRIKKLESEKRKQEKIKADAEKSIAAWSAPGLTMQKAKLISGYDHFSRCFTLAEFPRELPASQYEGQMGIWSALDGGVIDHLQAKDIIIPAKQRLISRCDKWINHYNNRLAYEKAMLGETGGPASEKWSHIEIGGRVLVRGEWVTVVRINKAGGVINSLTTNRRYVSKVGIEMVKDYQPPSDEQKQAAKAVLAKPPICNYPGTVTTHHAWDRAKPGEPQQTVEMTKKQWAGIYKDYKGTRPAFPSDQYGPHRVRYAFIDRTYKPVFIVDQKRVDPPKSDTVKSAPAIEPPEPVVQQKVYTPQPVNEDLQAMKDTLKNGIKAVAANNLFPTPKEICSKVADLAEVEPGQDILEPSAGTGMLLGCLGGSMFTAEPRKGSCTAVEINSMLCNKLEADFPLTRVICADFLELSTDTLGQFDRVIMNPPFEKGADIKHIRHAFSLLRPGGLLVAICANGPRQQEAFKTLAEHWEDMPSGTFKNQGTMVNTALFTLRKD